MKEFELKEIMEKYGENECVYLNSESKDGWTSTCYKYLKDKDISKVSYDSKHHAYDYEVYEIKKDRFPCKVKDVEKLKGVEWIKSIDILSEDGTRIEFTRNRETLKFRMR